MTGSHSFTLHLGHVSHCVRVALLLQMLFLFASLSLAEELEPRRWAHIPINTNFLGSGYAYTEADIGLDPVLRVENMELEMHTWLAKYTRSFALFDKTARIGVMQAYQEGTWTGLLEGAHKKINRSGWSDTIVRFAINLYGAPPLTGKGYAKHRASTEVETIIGAGMSVQLPTGDYMDDKLINLGSNRFTFRPQVGAMHTRGNWTLETTGTVALYSDNDDFFNGKKLEQDPLYTLNSHLIYKLRSGLWASASVGYDYGGRSTIDGDEKDNRKQNLAWAFSFGLPINRHLGAKLAYVGTRTQESTGMDSDTFAIGISAFW